MEKKQASETVAPLPPSYLREEAEQHDMKQPANADWAPGFIKQFPWLGFGALVGVLICMAGSIVVLILSDDKSQDVWIERLAPNVLVNIMNSVANICFAIAIGNGIAIAWWRKTLKGATIEELHRSWSFSTSLKEIVFSLKYFNVIALAAITAKLAIVDSTLMQKATSTTVKYDEPVKTTVYGYVNADFPLSGTITSDTLTGGQIFPKLNDALKVWDQVPDALPNTFTGCKGSCLVNVQAPGFHFQCDPVQSEAIDFSSLQQQYQDLALAAGENGGWFVNETQKQALKKDLFNVNFNYFPLSPESVDPSATQQNSELRMDLLYGQSSSNGAGCPGTMHTVRCFMLPSMVTYPVRIQTYDPKVGATDYMEVGQGERRAFETGKGQQSGFDIGPEIKVLESADGAAGSRLAGILHGLNMYLGANATILYEDGMFNGSGASSSAAYRVASEGKAAAHLTNSPAKDQCSYWYEDPMNPASTLTANIVGNINQMLFAWALDVASFKTDNSNFNGTHPRQAYEATMVKQSVHYVTKYSFMIGAIVSSVICVLLVVPSYWRFWQIGRKVTLGPLEIAHAFRSPMTAQAQSGNVDEVVKEVGQREIRYGHIVAGDAKGVVGIAEPEYVDRLAKAGSAKK